MQDVEKYHPQEYHFKWLGLERVLEMKRQSQIWMLLPATQYNSWFPITVDSKPVPHCNIEQGN